jgi:amino acid transporter
LTVNYPDYNPTNRQGTLFVFATVLLIWVVNTYLIGIVPFLQNVFMWTHVLAFLAIVIVLWTKAPLNSASDVFTKFTNEGGWSSTGLSLMIGQITAIYALVGQYSCRVRYWRTIHSSSRYQAPILQHTCKDPQVHLFYPLCTVFQPFLEYPL